MKFHTQGTHTHPKKDKNRIKIQIKIYTINQNTKWLLGQCPVAYCCVEKHLNFLIRLGLFLLRTFFFGGLKVTLNVPNTDDLVNLGWTYKTQQWFQLYM